MVLFLSLQRDTTNVAKIEESPDWGVADAQWGKLRSSTNKSLVVTPFPGLQPSLAI